MVFSRHEHRRPQNPPLVAHLVKVAGAISFSPIVRGRHRSATAFSFVLCGVPSASFVRGSHEQDRLFTAGRSEYRTHGGLAVTRSVEQFSGGASRLDDLIELLDRRRGVVLSSGPTGPGRYESFDLGFFGPPLGAA